MVVVADTSPIRYLISIHLVSLLQDLYKVILVPRAVWIELRNPSVPEAVRHFMASPPNWFRQHPACLA